MMLCICMSFCSIIVRLSLEKVFFICIEEISKKKQINTDVYNNVKSMSNIKRMLENYNDTSIKLEITIILGVIL